MKKIGIIKKLTITVLLLSCLHIHAQSPKGKEAWNEYLRNNLIYPEEAKKAGIKGAVLVRYEIDRDGFVSNIIVDKSIHPLLDREAMRLIANMPQHKTNERSSRSVYSHPIRFGVDETKENEKMADSIKMARLEKMGVVTRAERMPSFPGGQRALDAFLEKNLKYSKSAIKDKREERVNIEFVVNTDGSLSYIGIKRSVNPQLDTEAMRVVNMMPKWKPGTIQGQPVAVYYVQPIIFKGKDQYHGNAGERYANPSFHGGQGHLDDFIEKNMKYPLAAKDDSIEGRVFVDFIVNTNGKISDARILTSTDTIFNEEALRIVNCMPKWNCAKRKGQPVAMHYAIPINFTLNDKKNRYPLFPGGEEALQEYLRNEIKYPLEALLTETNGTVEVRYTIDEKGRTKDVELLKPAPEILFREVKQAIIGMPKWKPSKKDGKIASTRCTMHIKFVHPKEKHITAKRPHYKFEFEPFFR